MARTSSANHLQVRGDVLGTRNFLKVQRDEGVPAHRELAGCEIRPVLHLSEDASCRSIFIHVNLCPSVVNNSCFPFNCRIQLGMSFTSFRRRSSIISLLLALSLGLSGTGCVYLKPNAKRFNGIPYGMRGTNTLYLDVIRPDHPNGIG